MAIVKEDYTALITSQYQNSTKFLDWLSSGILQVAEDAATLLEGMDASFDLDTAVGPQLDVVGELVGLSRRLEVEIYESDVGFTWDDEDLGWDCGIWISGTETVLLDLPDDVYRTCIKVQIAANYWDGSIDQAYEIWQNLFGSNPILAIQNRLNMTMDFMMYGDDSIAIISYLFSQEYISFRPAGVGCTYHVDTVTEPFFAWDFDEGDTFLFAGWDVGQWSAGGFLEPT